MPPKPDLKRRSSGVLLHPTSLPGARGGDLGTAAREFVDFLADSGQSWWQVLPVCPPDGGGSPYNSPSAFAGSPSLISIDLLAAEGYLKKAELGQPKAKALRAALEHFSRRAPREDRDDFEAFRVRESAWLADHSLFCALREAHGGHSWLEWDGTLARRDVDSLNAARARLAGDLRYHDFVQWLFARQWNAVRVHAAVRGVGLIGDAPIYVSHDSADCWAHQELFYLDGDGRSTVVAGVPPDYFSATGQLWGNPLYRWDEHAARGFSWWVGRLKACAERFDAVRLDHFIAFRNYWEIGAAEKTAVNGRWVEAPGEALFETIRREVPSLQIIAEDLGTLTPPVVALRDKFSFPGMKIGQFSFGAENEWPRHWPENCVGYTGTHDNDTSRGWFEEQGGENAGRTAAQAAHERAAFLRAAGADAADSPSWAMAKQVWRSPARLAIAPMQDLLSMGAHARMNRPGSMDGNWRWRMEAGALTAAVAGRLGAMTGAAGRAPESF
jgi:4-alpha-glucanotransferase